MATANAAPFDVRVWLYPGADPAADPTDWGLEEDVSTYVRYPGGDGGQAITYARGRGDWASQLDAGTMSLTLDNRDGRFSTQNIAGAYYPDLKRNTPIRLGVVSGTDTFTRSSASGLGTADSGHTWTVTGTASDWTVDGAKAQLTIAANTVRVAVLPEAGGLDLDVTVTVIASAVATGAQLGAGPMLRYTDSSNTIVCPLLFQTDGTLTLHVYTYESGVSADAGSSVIAGTYSAGDRWKVRAQADGGTVRVKAWAESGDEPDAWAVTATQAANVGTGVGVCGLRVSGNTNTSPQLGFDDFTTIPFEWTGTVTSWPVRWDKSSNNCWAPIQAAGVLRRLRQGAVPRRSPLYQQLIAQSPIAYWPLEDGSGATSFGNAVSRGSPATYRDMSLAADSTLGGASVAPTTTDLRSMVLGSTTRRLTGHAGFAALIFTKLAAVPVASTYIVSWKATGAVSYWLLYLDSTTITVEGRAVDGTLVTSNTNVYVVDPTQWVAWQLETTVSGGTTNWALNHIQVGTSTFYTVNGSYASSTPSTAYAVVFGGGGDLATGTAVAHAWLGETTLPFVTGDFAQVSSGFAGELASDRIARLCDEYNVVSTIEAGESDPLGAQPIGTFLTMVQSAADADLGVLYERGSGLGYRPRSARYSPAVTMELSVADGDIAEPPEPVDDDQLLRNKWTVTRDHDGSAAVAQDDTSIAAEGLYEDSAEVNVYSDDKVPDHAGWRLHVSTQPGWRWPGIQLNFTRSPELLPSWRSRTHGFRVTVETGLDQVTGADPDVIVEGYSCELWPHGWTANLNCVQAGAWDVAALDDDARLDTDGSTLDADVAAADTSMSVATTGAATGSPLWNTDPATFPFDVSVGGQRATVDSISGSSSPQTFTLSAPLGIDRAAGTDVRLWEPTYLAL